MEDHISEDYFDFTQSYIGHYTINPNHISVLMHGLVVLGGYPLHPETKHYDLCVLVYEGVISSERTVAKYSKVLQEQEDVFYTIESEEKIKDKMPSIESNKVFQFTISCPTIARTAWIGWDITAEDVSIVIKQQPFSGD